MEKPRRKETHFQPGLKGQADQAALDVEERVDAPRGLQRDRGDRVGRFALADDRPFAGGAPPAALFFFSRDREKTHPNRHLGGWKGILRADAYGGYNRENPTLVEPSRWTPSLPSLSNIQHLRTANRRMAGSDY
jgi:hypothetical protein